MLTLKYKSREIFVCSLLWLLAALSVDGHDAKDFDDSVVYRIDFEMPDFDKEPDLKNHLRTFYTHEHEKYDCVIPVVQDAREEKGSNEPELCKNVKLQEYYLGKWSEEKSEKLAKEWESDRKAGLKYKTTKIENTNYPYFELEMTDGTMCDIINAPRVTHVRYVCLPHSKNEIYSFKEISSCHYEVIIITPLLCMIPAFHAEETKEVSIKCFNSPIDIHKPLSMLRQELNEMQLADDELPISKDANAAALTLSRSTTGNIERITFFNKIGTDVDKLVLELLIGAGVDVPSTPTVVNNNDALPQTPKAPITDLTAIKDFISGNNCLTGGTGWWKYEFCYGRHVRQFHKDKQSESELFLGYFSESSHRQWLTKNLDKMVKRGGYSTALWHHYDRGTHCDRTGAPREVDVKLMCTPLSSSQNTVSIYLLEPKTCQYILVVESPIVCDLMQLADEYGLVQEENIEQLIQKNSKIPTSEEDTTNSAAASESTKTSAEMGAATSNNDLNDAIVHVDILA
ncbi:endoplasmic reticulum lectin 1 isoform X2 [Eurosta solidaginis]|uniref:endoplasmic reticulum lectin 1 isoform X2 n=1 Tax=Eurosta solidaginis TaxID=178769 RepID=UPI0035307ADF